MSLILSNVLAQEDLERVRAVLDRASWISGKRTAGAAARGVKENRQADGGDPAIQSLERFVLDALKRHPMFEIAARPARITRILFSRYEPGMTYGAHTDDALMGGEDKLRTDLAFTLFLSDLPAYDGGGLMVDSALGEHEIRLPAGDAILYPAGSIHRVAPVEQGVRLAAVGWVQSFVPDQSQRELLFDLSVARARFGEADASKDQLLLLDKCVSNLLRMWAR